MYSNPVFNEASMARKKKKAKVTKLVTQFPALRVEVRGPRKLVTTKKVEQAIHKKLAAEPTDIFAHTDSLILLVQHQIGGTRSPE